MYIPQVVTVGCLGKQAYESKKLAEEIIRKRAVSGRQKSYKCKVCRKYHIGGAMRRNRG